jgi:hypothetical protein
MMEKEYIVNKIQEYGGKIQRKKFQLVLKFCQ